MQSVTSLVEWLSPEGLLSSSERLIGFEVSAISSVSPYLKERVGRVVSPSSETEPCRVASFRVMPEAGRVARCGSRWVGFSLLHAVRIASIIPKYIISLLFILMFILIFPDLFSWLDFPVFDFPSLIPIPMLPCHCFPAMVMAEAEILSFPKEARAPSSAVTPLSESPSLIR